MAKQRRNIFDLSDIVAVRIRSCKCMREILIDLSGKRYDLPDRCPFCNTEWNLLAGTMGNPQPIKLAEGGLLDLINTIRNDSHQSRVELLFEISDDGPERRSNRPQPEAD